MWIHPKVTFPRIFPTRIHPTARIFHIVPTEDDPSWTFPRSRDFGNIPLQRVFFFPLRGDFLGITSGVVPVQNSRSGIPSALPSVPSEFRSRTPENPSPEPPGILANPDGKTQGWAGKINENGDGKKLSGWAGKTKKKWERKLLGWAGKILKKWEEKIIRMGWKNG